MHAEATKGQREVLMDLPGDYSHEYFPRVSADGQWMVWGAAQPATNTIAQTTRCSRGKSVSPGRRRSV